MTIYMVAQMKFFQDLTWNIVMRQWFRGAFALHSDKNARNLNLKFAFNALKWLVNLYINLAALPQNHQVKKIWGLWYHWHPSIA